MQTTITDDLDALLGVLPPRIADEIRQQQDYADLLEVVMDLGRAPQIRFPASELMLDSKEVEEDDIRYVTSRLSAFSGDNRAGIERTLHRISAIRNRSGRIIGLTCRVGRAVQGTVTLIQDLVESGKSILLLGRPGVGKTTMLREVARVLADDLNKRVIVVDTSNEIAGDGDIPHPAIGRARRMQVPTPADQHAVMIEAVENHMPQAIIIDEIGTELEAAAARTIAERGVQLVGTAHGNTLENLVLNPTLSDLVGGIQPVVLSDEEARRRGTQKSILERKAPPTFDVVVEIQAFNRVAVQAKVDEVVDEMLRGRPPRPEIRWLDEQGRLQSQVQAAEAPSKRRKAEPPPPSDGGTQNIFPFGISRSKVEQAAKEMHLPVGVVDKLEDAALVVTSTNYYRRKPQKLRDAETAGLAVYVLKSNALSNIKQFLETTFANGKKGYGVVGALKEAEEAVAQVLRGKGAVELSPASSYVRRLQHQLAERYNLSSRSFGKEPRRRVRVFREDDSPVVVNQSEGVL